LRIDKVIDRAWCTNFLEHSVYTSSSVVGFYLRLMLNFLVKLMYSRPEHVIMDLAANSLTVYLSFLVIMLPEIF